MRSTRASSWLVVFSLVAGAGFASACASGTSGEQTVDAAPDIADAPSNIADAARVNIDAPGRPIDAPTVVVIDAAIGIDAPSVVIDAAPMNVADAAVPKVDATPTAPDAAPVITPDAQVGCTVMQLPLLANGAFDDSPLGVSWIDDAQDPNFPIISVSPSGLVPDTEPNLSWFGGADDAQDHLLQNVMIPAGTTSLVLSGSYLIGTAEDPSGIFDVADIRFTDAAGSGTVLEPLAAFDNTDSNTDWTPFTVTSASTFAGQMIRFEIDSATDSSNNTNFFFDTLQLTATVCR